MADQLLQEIAKRHVDQAVASFVLASQSTKGAKAAKHGCADKKYSKQMKAMARRQLAPKGAASPKAGTIGRKAQPQQRRGVEPYQATVAPDGKTATIYVYGDVTPDPRPGTADVSLDSLATELAELPETVEELTVRINSYGGDVFQGIAIYNTLKAWDGKVTTCCDGLACSIASVIFMAGEERIMAPASMLFVHNAWKITVGNAADHRKAADDLDAITNLTVAAYMEHATCTEEELRAMMDAETWLDAAQGVELGLATGIEAVSAKAQARMGSKAKTAARGTKRAASATRRK